MMERNEHVNALWQKSKMPLAVLGGFVALLWLVEILDWLIFKGALDGYGIKPRTVDGLFGILWAPFLHGGVRHLMANTVPILILGGLIIVSRGIKDFFLVTGVVMIISGLGTWLIGPSLSVHIGASGMVFGYFGFLLLMAYFDRSCQAIVVAGIVLFFYGGLVWGVLPRGDGISWQSHLFGLIGGVMAAYLLGQRRGVPGPERSFDEEIVVHDSYDL